MQRKMLLVWLAACGMMAACVGFGAGLSTAFASEALVDGNLVGNPSFELDFHNNHAEGHVLAFRGDWSFNGSDGKPDYWDPTGAWELKVGPAHTGDHALLLKGGGTASRSFPTGVVSGGRGSGDWRWGGPPTMDMTYDHPLKAARGARAQLWFKSRGLGGASKLTLTINAFGVSKSVEAAADPADWQPLQVTLTRDEIEKAWAAPDFKQALPKDISLAISVAGAAEALIDDVSLAEDPTQDPSFAANYSFEDVDKTGYPQGWSQPVKYTWRPPQYYQWTDWHHRFEESRGPVTTTDLMAHSGRRSLLMQIYPGDETMVVSAPIPLNQMDRGIVEIGVFVMADRAKWLDIRAVDQDGADVPAIAAFSGGWKAPPDNFQIFPSNAHTWVYIRKWFQGEKPLKAIRPQLCVRGFNGDTRNDGGYRPQVCQTGLVWWDDVRVVERSATVDELKARNLKPAAPVKDAPDTAMIASLDLGERMFGQNEATIVLLNPTNEEIKVWADLIAVGTVMFAHETPNVKIPPGQSQPVKVPYQISQLEGRWDHQGEMILGVTVGKDHRKAALAYNTWPEVVDVGFARHYPTVAENPQVITINLGVAKGTLSAIKSIVVDVCTRRDDKPVVTVNFPDPAAAFADTAAKFGQYPKVQFGIPGPIQFADRKNLIALPLDLAKLPAHPFDQPVRDHYVRVRGLDADGKELFSGASEPIGRVQAAAETLPKITSTEVRKDGAVLINGQPVFLMAGNNYTTGDYGLNPEQNKTYGFNCIRWVEGVDAAAENWKANLYSLETMVQGAPFDNGPAAVQAWLEPKLREWLGQGKLDGAVTISPFYESGTHLDKPEAIAGQAAYTKVCHEAAHRISNFGGGGAHNIYTIEKSFDAFDSFGVEIEPMGPPRGGYELAPALRKGGIAWFHLPQTYSTTPYDQFRFDQYAVILQGGRGFSTIHGLGDPSFMRGITGELRYLSPAIFSLDLGPNGTAVSSDLWWMQRKNGDKVTLIAASKPPCEIGKWAWREDNVAAGRRAHSGVSQFMPNPTPDGIRLHGFREAKPIMIQKGDKLITSVWLDPKATPSAIAWGVRGDAKWDFNGHWGKAFDFAKWRADFINAWFGGELLPGTWQIAWQPNEQMRDWFADHILTPKSFAEKGALPATGQWVKLELSADELGLVGKQIDGFFYLSKDGEAWWDHSAIVRGDQEIVMCEDTVGPPSDELAAVKIAVPWALDGTRVKVLFEERDLAVKGGAFVDDFRGVDTYQSVRGGAIGDVAGWFPAGTPDSGLKAQTLGYVTPNGPVEVHVYEIVPGQR